jgi:VanZ family protein
LHTGEGDGGLLNKVIFPNLWLTIGLLLVMLVVGASLMPNPPRVAHFEGSDKLGHFAAYIATTFWFHQIYTRNRVRWTIALALVVLGISLEYLQRLSGFRTFEYADIGANAAGVLCALLLAQTRLSRSLVMVERSLLRCIGQERLGIMIYHRPMG